jgi:hypothetical protein
VSHFDEQGEIENNKVDYNEIPSPREGVEFNAKAQRDQFLGGGGKPTEATNTSGTFQEQQNKREQQPITAPKGEVEAFRMQSAEEEAYNRFSEVPGELNKEVFNVTLGQDPEKIFTYLSQNWNNLNEQEKFFLQVTGTKRKYEQSDHPDAGETVTLRGDEAAKFMQYREVQEFDESLDKVLESKVSRDR